MSKSADRKAPTPAGGELNTAATGERSLRENIIAVSGVGFFGSLVVLVLMGITGQILPEGVFRESQVVKIIFVVLIAVLGVSLPTLLIAGLGKGKKIAAMAKRAGWLPAPDSDAIAVIRTITALSNEVVSSDPAFPGPLLANGVLDRPNGPVRVAIPPNFRTGKEYSQLGWAHLWLRLPDRLPPFVLIADLPGVRALATDIDIESEQFNRRYRVFRRKAAEIIDHATLSDADFRRYAVGLLHPRAVEVLLGPRIGRLNFGIRGNLLFATTATQRAVIEQTADTLLAFAALIPRTTYDAFGR